MKIAIACCLLCVVPSALFAQTGFYVSSGPEIGPVFQASGGRVSIEPGVYIVLDRERETLDSINTRYRTFAAGLALQVRWIREPAAALSPVGGIRLAIGKDWGKSDLVQTYPGGIYESHSEFSPIRWLAGIQAGIQARLSDRVALTAEYALRYSVAEADQKRSTVTLPTGVPPTTTTSTQSRRFTDLYDTFVLRVRVVRAPRGAGAP